MRRDTAFNNNLGDLSQHKRIYIYRSIVRL